MGYSLRTWRRYVPHTFICLFHINNFMDCIIRHKYRVSHFSHFRDYWWRRARKLHLREFLQFTGNHFVEEPTKTSASAGVKSKLLWAKFQKKIPITPTVGVTIKISMMVEELMTKNCFLTKPTPARQVTTVTQRMKMKSRGRLWRVLMQRPPRLADLYLKLWTVTEWPLCESWNHYDHKKNRS